MRTQSPSIAGGDCVDIVFSVGLWGPWRRVAQSIVVDRTMPPLSGSVVLLRQLGDLYPTSRSEFTFCIVERVYWTGAIKVRFEPIGLEFIQSRPSTMRIGRQHLRNKYVIEGCVRNPAAIPWPRRENWR